MGVASVFRRKDAREYLLCMFLVPGSRITSICFQKDGYGRDGAISTKGMNNMLKLQRGEGFHFMDGVYYLTF